MVQPWSALPYAPIACWTNGLDATGATIDGGLVTIVGRDLMVFRALFEDGASIRGKPRVVADKWMSSIGILLDTKFDDVYLMEYSVRRIDLR